MKHSLLFTLLLGFSLPMLAQPVITQNPVGTVICPDTCAALTVSAIGNELTYQWFEVIAGTSQPVGFDSTGIVFCAEDYTADSIQVYCIVTDSGGLTDQSNTVALHFDSCLAPVANFGFVIFGDSVCFTDSSLRADNVLWNFGNGGQSTERNPCYDYNDYQLFFVRLYAFNDYGSDEIEKEVSTLAIGDVKSLEAALYPNPVTDLLHLQAMQTMELIQLYDLSGRLAFSKNSNAISEVLDLSTLHEGIYVLRITAGGAQFTQRIIKL